MASDPATSYFIPATTGHRAHGRQRPCELEGELALSEEGYRLLRRYYGRRSGLWQAAQEMWRRGVRYVIVAKETTLEPKSLDDFIWQNARLRTRRRSAR